MGIETNTQTKYYISCADCGRVCRVMRSIDHDIVQESKWFTCKKCPDIDPATVIRTGNCIDCGKTLSKYNDSPRCHVCRRESTKAPTTQEQASMFVCWVCGKSNEIAGKTIRMCGHCAE